LLKALADFPAVVSRRIDAEPDASSPWHELGRALIAKGVGGAATVSASVHLREFGERALIVNGAEVRPRLAKSYELLAYVVTRPDAQAAREELLDVLFDGRADDSTRAYLRQIVHELRVVLPDDVELNVTRGRVRLQGEVRAISDSTRFESQLAEAASLQGGDRLAALLAALRAYDRGEYLPGAKSAWVDERRQQLADVATTARYEAAELAFGEGRYDDAQRLNQGVLHADAFREAAWRLAMRIANVMGDDDGVISAFQGCERALGQIGTEPSAGTRQLLERLRR
jgi:DNA-binding SARP family transcriptional activator